MVFENGYKIIIFAADLNLIKNNHYESLRNCFHFESRFI